MVVLMSNTGSRVQSGAHLTLSIWHPDCWTLEVTQDADGGLFGHGVYQVQGKVKGQFTAYGESEDALDDLVDAIEASRLTDSVWQRDRQHGFDQQPPTPGNTSRSLLVEYEEDDSINDALVSNGFIPDRAVWIHDGREYWTVVIEEERDEIQTLLDRVREEMNADIDIQHIVSDTREGGDVLQRSILSARQREVFELARERGYYNWPREINATDLAEELGVSKATVLEHLRKAEARLVDQLP